MNSSIMTTTEQAAFSRAEVRGWIEDAAHTALSLADASADTLVADAQARGMTPGELRAWIYARFAA